MELSIEILEKGSYYKLLQILKLERELGLNFSKFMNDFPAKSEIYIVHTI